MTAVSWVIMGIALVLFIVLGLYAFDAEGPEDRPYMRMLEVGLLMSAVTVLASFGVLVSLDYYHGNLVSTVTLPAILAVFCMVAGVLWYRKAALAVVEAKAQLEPDDSDSETDTDASID